MLRSLFRPFALVFICALLAVAALPVQADETADLGRTVFESVKASVVTLKVVVSISFGQEEQENETEANATVIAPDGLAVLSLTAVDPVALFQSMGEAPDGVSSKLVSLKMVLADGSEKPADVVLRDKDLDLAFVRPTDKPGQPMACASLENIGQPQILDSVVVVGQLGSVAQRAHMAFVDRIEGVVEKPRKFYIMGEHRAQQVVCSPVFLPNGQFVGVGVMRAVKGNGGSASARDNMLIVIVPGDQVKELLAQVPPRS